MFDRLWQIPLLLDPVQKIPVVADGEGVERQGF